MKEQKGDKIMIFDAHADIWTHVTQQREKGKEDIIRNYHLEKMKKGNICGGIFVVWVDPPYDVSPKERTMQIIKNMSLEINNSKDIIHIVKDSKDFDKAVKEKKLAVVIGFEGLKAIEDDIELIDTLYMLGVRHAMLTWNEKNELAGGAAHEGEGGLTDKGKNIIKRMEALGMIIDVSHTNEQTFWDIAAITEKPIIASHSNCRSLCDVPRNLSDEALKEIKRHNGVVGINSYKEFIDKDHSRQTMQRIGDHIDHMVEIMGIDNVGFGFDFGDYLSNETLSHYVKTTGYGVEGLEDVTETENIINELVRRGYSEEAIEKISYKNFYRVIAEILG